MVTISKSNSTIFAIYLNFHLKICGRQVSRSCSCIVGSKTAGNSKTKPTSNFQQNSVSATATATTSTSIKKSQFFLKQLITNNMKFSLHKSHQFWDFCVMLLKLNASNTIKEAQHRSIARASTATSMSNSNKWNCNCNGNVFL